MILPNWLHNRLNYRLIQIINQKMENSKTLKSGEFLVSEVESKDIFIPEEFNEEQKMIAQTCRDFLEAEVYPNLEKVEKSDRELMKSILKKAGELGFMGISIPEEFGGFGQSFVTQMLVQKQPVQDIPFQ